MSRSHLFFFFFFFNDTATTEIYTLSLHDALPISCLESGQLGLAKAKAHVGVEVLLEAPGHDQSTVRLPPALVGLDGGRSEEHTSELQSLRHLVCRLLLEKKKKKLAPRKTEGRRRA